MYYKTTYGDGVSLISYKNAKSNLLIKSFKSFKIDISIYLNTCELSTIRLLKYSLSAIIINPHYPLVRKSLDENAINIKGYAIIIFIIIHSVESPGFTKLIPYLNF